MGIGGAIESVSNLISEFVEDPDKQAELKVAMTKAILQTTTTPKTDSIVKLLIAFRDIVIPMLRPLGAAAMTAFGMWCHYKGLDIDTGAQLLMDGAFPAWGTSRHLNKQKAMERRTRRATDPELDDDEYKAFQ